MAGNHDSLTVFSSGYGGRLNRENFGKRISHFVAEGVHSMRLGKCTVKGSVQDFSYSQTIVRPVLPFERSLELLGTYPGIPYRTSVDLVIISGTHTPPKPPIAAALLTWDAGGV